MRNGISSRINDSMGESRTTLLRVGAQLLADRAGVEDVLWHLWWTSAWPQRMRRRAPPSR